jgi:hypothetical protein
MPDTRDDENTTTANIATEKILVFMNAAHLLMVVTTTCFFAALFSDLGEDGTMRAAVTYAVFLFSDLGFFGIGFALKLLSRTVEVTASNKWMVWLSIPVFSILSLPDLYAEYLGFFPSDPQMAMSAIVACLLFAWWNLSETVPVWKRVNGGGR